MRICILLKRRVLEHPADERIRRSLDQPWPQTLARVKLIDLVRLPLLTQNIHYPKDMGPLPHWDNLPRGWETLV